MISRRRFIGAAAGGLLVLRPRAGAGQEGVFLQAEESVRHLFPDAAATTERTVPSTPALRARIRAFLAQPPTFWEPGYRVFAAKRGDAVLGFVVVVEEIGKHRPITYAVAIRPDGTVHDLTVLAYREAYGGEIKERRFLKQYVGKPASAPLLPYQDIQNIAGATLSVQATGRAIKKAIAVLKAMGELG